LFFLSVPSSTFGTVPSLTTVTTLRLSHRQLFPYLCPGSQLSHLALLGLFGSSPATDSQRTTTRLSSSLPVLFPSNKPHLHLLPVLTFGGFPLLSSPLSNFLRSVSSLQSLRLPPSLVLADISFPHLLALVLTPCMQRSRVVFPTPPPRYSRLRP